MEQKDINIKKVKELAQSSELKAEDVTEVIRTLAAAFLSLNAEVSAVSGTVKTLDEVLETMSKEKRR